MTACVQTPTELAARTIELHSVLSQPRNLPMLRDYDMVAAVPQTEVWTTVPLPDGRWAVSQGKITVYDIPLADYPTLRKGLNSVEVSRRIRQWGRELPPGHPAYAEVSALAARLGSSPRKTFTVFEVVLPHAEKQPEGGEIKVTETNLSEIITNVEESILAAVGALVPLLGPAARAKVAGMIAA